jgi:hypothetical protein
MDIVIKSISAVQLNRVLRDKLPRFGVEVTEAVVVEAGFSILVLALVMKRTILRSAPAHVPIAVELQRPSSLALRVVQGERGTQVVAHHALCPLLGELGQRGKAVLLE